MMLIIFKTYAFVLPLTILITLLGLIGLMAGPLSSGSKWTQMEATLEWLNKMLV